MSTPDPIEPIHFSEPRAVSVREPEDLNVHHSAVSGTMNVYVDSATEAREIMVQWRVIMQAAADKATEILNEIRLGDDEQ